MRSGAQIISYELSIGMTMLTVICLTGTMSFSEICQQQATEGWNLFRGHLPAVLAFIIYLIAGNAECNRGPFDLPESESELTAGYHTEYSGMHFGYYYLAEYLNLFICAAMATTIFPWGGWAPLHIAGLDGFNLVMDYIPGAVWFLGKSLLRRLPAHVVALDLPSPSYRPDTDARVEVPRSHQHAQPHPHGACRILRLALLSTEDIVVLHIQKTKGT